MGRSARAPPPTPARGDIEQQLDKAVRELNRVGYLGDLSGPRRRLLANLEQDPEHLESLWYLVRIELAGTLNLELWESAPLLASVGPAINHLVELAKDKGKPGFVRYVLAEYAERHNNFDRALAEIDAALALAPDSVRFEKVKAGILLNRGRWRRSDEDIETGVVMLEEILQRTRGADLPYFTSAGVHFQIAYAINDMREPRWNKVVEHYLAAIELSPPQEIRVAYAWNNIGTAYRRLGRCDKALEAAENALAIMDFGAARQHKRFSEFCLKLEGLMDAQDRMLLFAPPAEDTPREP